MAVNIIKRTWHQNQMVKIEPLNGFAFQAESGGHTFQISGVDDSGNAVPISGTIAGVFLRPDNTDVALTGSASGGVASVTLKSECYAVPGRFLLTVYATSGSNKGTIYAAMGTVSRTSSGAVSPAVASDVVDLVNRINAATATIPASYTTLLNAVAGDYSDTKTYAVKDFVWYNGHLYRCTTAITTAETWTASHWNQVVLSDALNQDIAELKNTLDVANDDINNAENAIKNISDSIGDLNKLETDTKENTVDAINEVNEKTIINRQRTETLANDTVRLATVYLVDNDGNYVVDNAENKLIGEIYLPIVDNDWGSDVYPAPAKIVGKRFDNLEKRVGYTFLDGVDKIAYKGWNDIPILFIDNMPESLLAIDASKASGEATSATFDFPAFGIHGKLKKVKVQGNSSQTLPKKNYTLTFSDNVKLVDSWGYHKKYVIKANFNDYSQSRNVCSAKLWGRARRQRIGEDNAFLVDASGNKLIDPDGGYLIGDINPQLASAINCGAVDGFPIMVYMNGEYWGVYCFNTPKDDYMANMGDGDRECILCADNSTTQAELFQAIATLEPDSNGHCDFEVEYASDGFDNSQILESLNTMLGLVVNTHSDYKNVLSPYIDFGSAIDYYILSALTDNIDGISKNYLLQTWDGVKWYFCAYDMDMTFGNISSRGNELGSPANGRSFRSIQDKHRMFHIIYAYCRDELVARYKQLRSTVFSESNLDTLFGRFVIKIPKNAYDYETLRWPQTTGTSVKTFDQICNWYRLRIQLLDAEIAQLES